MKKYNEKIIKIKERKRSQTQLNLIGKQIAQNKIEKNNKKQMHSNYNECRWTQCSSLKAKVVTLGKKCYLQKDISRL